MASPVRVRVRVQFNVACVCGDHAAATQFQLGFWLFINGLVQLLLCVKFNKHLLRPRETLETETD